MSRFLDGEFQEIFQNLCATDYVPKSETGETKGKLQLNKNEIKSSDNQCVTDGGGEFW